MMKRLVAGMLVLIMGGAAVFAGGGKQGGGAGSSSGEPVVIRWAFWGNETRIRLSQQAADAYQAANPGVKINIEPAGNPADHFSKVDTQMAGGNAPDIIQIGGNFPDYAKRDVLLPLDAYRGNLLNAAAFDAGALETGAYEGKLWGVTVGVTVPALFYNKSMLERAGAPLPKVSMTYDEFRAYLMSIKPKLPAGVYPMADFGITASGYTPFGYWLRYNGTPIYETASHSTRVKISDIQKYLDLWKDYRDNGLIPPAEIAADYPENNTDSSTLVAGKAVIGFATCNQLTGYQAAMTDELGIIELPGAAATKALWPGLSAVFSVYRNSKNIEEAVKFINFVTTSPEAGKILANNRGVSASPSYRAGISGDPIDQKIIEYMNVAGTHSSPETDHLPNDMEMATTAFLSYQQAAFGRITTAQGAQQIYDLILRLMNK